MIFEKKPMKTSKTYISYCILPKVFKDKIYWLQKVVVCKNFVVANEYAWWEISDIIPFRKVVK